MKKMGTLEETPTWAIALILINPVVFFSLDIKMQKS